MKKQQEQKDQSWFEKKTSIIPFKIREMLYWALFAFLIILPIVTEWSYLDTLLPICLPWMYFKWVQYSVPFMVYPIIKYFRKPSEKKKKKDTDEDPYWWKVAIVMIFVPAVIFLPNRHIPIEPEKEYQGVIIDQTSAMVNKSPSCERNYIKIRLNEENTSFWYCLNHESKTIGRKCIVSVRRGIFGMRYVEKVDFIVE